MADGGDDRCSTPRGNAELIDFDELEMAEGQRGGKAETAPGRATGDQQPVGAQECMSGPMQWEEWFSEGCRKALAGEEEQRQDFWRRQDELGQELAVSCEELEAVARERRQQQGSPEGVVGARITVRPAEASGAGSKWERRFFCDAVNANLAAVHKLLADRERAAWAGLGDVDCRLAAVEYLLSEALPRRFARRAATAACEDVLGCLEAPRQGLSACLQQLLGSAAAEEPSREAVRGQMDAQLASVASGARRLLDCLLPACPEEADRLEAAYAEATAVLSSKSEAWPVWVARHRALVASKSIKYARSLGCVTRTCPRAITRLLCDLRAGFQERRFQAKYRELRQSAQGGQRVDAEMFALTFEVQRKVLPRYGFEASPVGLADMFGETDMHADQLGPRSWAHGDRVVAKLRQDILQALDMEADFEGRYHAPQFHTVGDSHAMMGWPPSVCVHWLGPVLCYSVTRVDVRRLSPPVMPGDAVCFCFGEIDCRAHVHKHCSRERPYGDVIDHLVERYFQHICSQRALLPAGVRVCVYNVPPPQYRHVLERSWTFVPCQGEDEERRSYVLYFNSRLKQECRRLGFVFFDVYEPYTDEQGFLAADYSDTTVHIADGVWIEKFLQELKLQPVRQSHIKSCQGKAAGAQ